MDILGWTLLVLALLYWAICLGRIAGKLGHNPWLFGVLALISPLNLLALGYLAFSRRAAAGGHQP